MAIGHPVFWILLCAVLAPLLAEIPLRFKVPVVVIEVVLGILIGPHVFDLVQFEGFVPVMFTLGMALTLFMAGMELDFGQIRGQPLALASLGWILSVVLGFISVAILHVIPQEHAPMMVTLALCTTGLGVLLPVFRDGGGLETPFGRLVMAAGTLGELGPIVVMSLLLSTRYSTWQEAGFLAVFLAIVGMAIAIGMGVRTPRLLALLSRHMHASTQLPVRISFLMLAALFALAKDFGFESIFGAFAAGMIVGQATRGRDGKPLREKIEGVAFGWFYPFFFVGIGIKFDATALVQDLATMLLVPTFAFLFLFARGVPVLLYRRAMTPAQRLPFVLASAVPSLSIIVVITEIGTAAKKMTTDIAAALVGAALLSIMVYPTIAGFVLQREEAPRPLSGTKGSVTPQ